jgi:excisionase family DNA binding protein
MQTSHGRAAASISPRALAVSVGLSESSVRRWVDAGVLRATRTVGGHRRIPIAEALRLIRRRRLPVVRPDLLDLDPEVMERMQAEPFDVTDRLHGLVLDDRPDQACALAAALFLQGWSLAELFDGPFCAVMRRVGELWHEDELGIFVEHRATETCVRVINHLHALVEGGADGPVALGGALEGDPYRLPPLMSACVLAGAGFQSINAGVDTPLAALRAAVHAQSPEVVWVSVNAAVPPERAERLAAFAEEMARRGTRLVVGGRALADGVALPETAQRVASMAELAAFASGVRGVTAPESS